MKCNITQMNEDAWTDKSLLIIVLDMTLERVNRHGGWSEDEELFYTSGQTFIQYFPPHFLWVSLFIHNFFFISCFLIFIEISEDHHTSTIGFIF